ncbi:MAG: TRAP transporter large permease [Gammaproteobacteria bacterium]
MTIWIISLLAVFLFFTGTPIILIIAMWVAGTSYFVVDYPMAHMGIGATDTIKVYVFLAVPLFVATGDFLTAGGISQRLVAFSRSLVSIFPGSTAATTMVSCGLFAAVSGSNSATAATMGRLLGPELKKRGVSPGLAASLVAAGGTVGVIIPPSVIFIVYGVTVNVSSVDLFLGGLIPGALLVICLIASAVWLTRKVEPSEGLSSFRLYNIAKKALEAWIGFIAIGVIFFGIYWGYFSPTEAAGVVTIYCFLAGWLITRKIKFRQLRSILLQSAALTGMIMPLVAFSVQFQQVASVMGMQETIQGFLEAVGTDIAPAFSVAIMMLLILMVGAITESIAVVLILGPILAPVAAGFGISPIHWGVVFVLGTTIGFVTPPYGLNLFVVSGVMDVPYAQVISNIFKLLIPLMVAWILVALMPWTTLLLQNVN